MDSDNIQATLVTLPAIAVNVGLKVLGAIVLYLVGRALINWLISLVQRSLEKQKVDPTLLRYVGTVISVLANIALVIAILGYFGVETTSFAALLAGAGLAIGTAWGGLLSNFASGAFLVILRPYRVGDFVNAGDVIGTVRASGLFVTTIDTMDGVQTHVGNGKVMSGTIQNFSANPVRRVDLKAQLHHSVDVVDAITRLKAKLAAIPNVAKEEAQAGIAELLAHFILLRLVPRENVDARDPFREQMPGHRASERASPTGDDDGGARELRHLPPLPA